MARVKYQGVKKANVTWTSMGKVYSYNVRPGEVISIPDDQVSNIRATAAFSIISAPGMNKNQPKVIKKILPKENPVKIKKLTPIVEPEIEDVPEPEVEDFMEDLDEDIDTESETKELPISGVSDVEVVQTDEDDKVIDYTSIRKDDLKDMCRERGLKVSGNRDDLIARLVMFDKGVIVEE